MWFHLPPVFLQMQFPKCFRLIFCDFSYAILQTLFTFTIVIPSMCCVFTHVFELIFCAFSRYSVFLALSKKICLYFHKCNIENMLCFNECNFTDSLYFSDCNFKNVFYFHISRVFTYEPQPRFCIFTQTRKTWTWKKKKFNNKTMKIIE